LDGPAQVLSANDGETKVKGMVQALNFLLPSSKCPR